MNQLSRLLLACVIALSYANNVAASSAAMKEIRFSSLKEGVAQLDFVHTGKVSFKIKEVPNFDQVIVLAAGVALPPKLTKVIDGSMSQTPVVQITPYNAGREVTEAKIIIQLKEKVKLQTKENKGVFSINFTPLFAQRDKYKSSGASKLAFAEDKVSLKAAATSKYEESVATAQELIKTLDTPEEERVYKGAKISFDSAEARVYDIFKLVGEASGLNIVAATQDILNATISLSLKDVYWDQLIDIVLQQHRLKASAVGNVIHVMTMAEYVKAQEEKRKALIASDELEPTIMAIIPVSFAKASDLKSMIDKLLRKEDLTANKEAEQKETSTVSEVINGKTITKVINGSDKEKTLQAAFIRGVIETDEASNSLIVTNTKDAIERIRSLVKELDIALPQVLIDAKIVIAKEEWSKTLGVNWAGRATTSGAGRAGVGLSFNGGQIVTSNTNTSGPAFSIASKEGTFASGFQIGSGQNGNLGLQISLGEVSGQNKVVASPRIIVNNKKTATVNDGVKLTILTSGVNAAGSLVQLDAGLKLDVTPQITNAGSVLLDLDIQKNLPVANTQNVEEKGLKTQVLVESGGTMVLGGIYSYENTEGERGIPVLKDLPFIGQLFRTNTTSWGKSELMVFVTPKILEPGPTGAPATL